MIRIVQPELLDELPSHDPLAVASRRDLHRLNGLMRNAVAVSRAIRGSRPSGSRLQIFDLGAGDGQFLLRVAHRVAASNCAHVDAWLVDQQELLRPETQGDFQKLNWNARAVRSGILDFLEHGSGTSDVALANLFLHHFTEEPLRKLLRLASKRTHMFVAVEPRRAALPLFVTRWLWAIGCNSVTRHDARVSVRAGFAGRELSELWPDKADWRLIEKRSGLFSHVFVAERFTQP